ncbi:ATP-binding protein [Candidatus Saccharibacteria bacterium]|nr:ATP-binding protein [Candidatus Saccharibacteria bacterium]
MSRYLPRLIDKLIEEDLRLYGAVSIEGCKWCGKSTTAARFARSKLELQNPNTRQSNLSLAANKPSLLLEGEKPRMIDEWQDAPELWDAVRYDVDQTGLVGQYILTGSSVPRKKQPKHSGAGRIARITMRPMSLFESGDSNGKVSLEDLFSEEADVEGISELTLEDVAYLAARGGWPENVLRKPEKANKLAKDYLNTILGNDVNSEDVVAHNPSKMRVLLRSLARNIASPASINTILEDTKDDRESTISDVTISTYLATLERIHIIDDVEAWCPDLRSKTQIRTSKKRNFVDPSLAVAALRASEKDLLNDFNTFGLVFESLALRDLQIYAQSLDGDLFYYRDKNGLECDAVVHLPDGKWGAIEIKLGADEETLDKAASNLIKFKEAVDTSSMKEPSFLMILSGISTYAYRRRDGVFVIPIGCLKN